MIGRIPHWLLIVGIVTAAMGCDNVSWGGMSLRLEGPPGDTLAPPPGDLGSESEAGPQQDRVRPSPLRRVRVRETRRSWCLWPSSWTEDFGPLPQGELAARLADQILEERLSPGQELDSLPPRDAHWDSHHLFRSRDSHRVLPFQSPGYWPPGTDPKRLRRTALPGSRTCPRPPADPPGLSNVCPGKSAPKRRSEPGGGGPQPIEGSMAPRFFGTSGRTSRCSSSRMARRLPLLPASSSGTRWGLDRPPTIPTLS